MKEPRPRVLIVDDDTEIRNILQESLSRLYDCITSASATDALAMLAKESFDVVMSDISMPQMTGLEMMPYLAALAPDSIVVMISGQRMIESAIEAMRAGAFDYITKPFELTQVASVVRRALDHRQNLRRSHSHANRMDAAARQFRQALADGDFVVYYQPQIEIIRDKSWAPKRSSAGVTGTRACACRATSFRWRKKPD